uniref:tRNA-splicing endonuclease subunit Sen34 n=1 Tax=Scylla olivacea TaxID=85551 RepID=A0A0P4WW26_SCYOL
MEAQNSTKSTTKEEGPSSPSKVACTETRKVQVAVNHGQGYIWDVSDVWHLWRNCRMVGCLVGSLPRHPHQSCTLGLPLRLLPEEVTLLVEEGLGETVRYKEMEEKPSQTLKDTFSECRERCYKEQVQEAAIQRREQVKRMADKILEGKRKKFLIKQKEKNEEVNGSETNGSVEEEFTLTREDVIQEEEAKLQPLPQHLQIVEVFTRHPLLDQLTTERCPWPYPTTQEERVRYKVFCDLWHQGHYLTSGIKFGGNFLVYAGDPHLYHAHAIVRCVREQQLRQGGEVDLVAATRVAASTKKTFVLASLDNDGQVLYRSYHWFEEVEEEEEENMDENDEEL